MTGILDVFSKASQTPSLAIISREPSGGSLTWSTTGVTQALPGCDPPHHVMLSLTRK